MTTKLLNGILFMLAAVTCTLTKWIVFLYYLNAAEYLAGYQRISHEFQLVLPRWFGRWSEGGWMLLVHDKIQRRKICVFLEIHEKISQLRFPRILVMKLSHIMAGDILSGSAGGTAVPWKTLKQFTISRWKISDISQQTVLNASFSKVRNI